MNLTKKELRKKYTLIRDSLSEERKKNATNVLSQTLPQELSSFASICSFASTDKEINLTELNEYLCKKNKLILLQASNEKLTPYQVKDLNKELEKHKKLNFYQPIGTFCKKIPLKLIDCILVPGIVFDRKGNRIGHGFGYYDQFLKHFIDIPVLGVGYKEQLSTQIIPTDSHDIPMTSLRLF